MKQSGLLADTILQLEAYLAAAEHQLHLQQTNINKVRFIVAALRDESDVSSMSSGDIQNRPMRDI